jgi:hypothetical protein
MTVKIQNPDEHMKLAKHTFSYFLNTHSDKKGSICLPYQPLLHEGIEETSAILTTWKASSTES